jgi:hypothetical protein
MMTAVPPSTAPGCTVAASAVRAGTAEFFMESYDAVCTWKKMALDWIAFTRFIRRDLPKQVSVLIKKNVCILFSF